MERNELIEQIIELRKNLKPSLVRRQEQLKGIEWLLQQKTTDNSLWLFLGEQQELFDRLKKIYGGN